MTSRTKYSVGIVLVALALLLPRILQAQGELTLEGLADQVQTLFVHQENADARIAALETAAAPTSTRTPRPTPNLTATRAAQEARAKATVQARITGTAVAKATARAVPAATISPDLQAALDESAANQWANDALDKARREKGVNWRRGGWMEWYNRPNIVKVFMKIVDRCDLTGEELIAEIDKYERDRTVVAMNEEYEPNITNELAIFRDYNRAAGNNMMPCSKLVDQFKNLYKKEQE